METIKLTNVSKKIKGKQILNGINLELSKGKVHGFSGPNGCGKSVLFRIIAGLVIPSAGTVTVFGKNIYSPKRTFPENMGIMIDAIGLYPHFNAIENLSYLAAIKNKIGKKEIIDVISRVGLDPYNKAPYSKYSLGMKQRLVIAQVLMEKPQLMIFDEPTNALDKNGITLFRQIINEEKSRGATILISSHNFDDLTSLCENIYNLNDGKIVS